MFCLACGPFGFYAVAQTAPHHGEGGFRNNYPHRAKESFWRWKWEQLQKGVPEPPPGGWRFPHVRTDAAAVADEPPAELARLRERAGLATDQFDVMAIGETRAIASRRRP